MSGRHALRHISEIAVSEGIASGPIRQLAEPFLHGVVEDHVQRFYIGGTQTFTGFEAEDEADLHGGLAFEVFFGGSSVQCAHQIVDRALDGFGKPKCSDSLLGHCSVLGCRVLRRTERRKALEPGIGRIVAELRRRSHQRKQKSEMTAPLALDLSPELPLFFVARRPGLYRSSYKSIRRHPVQEVYYSLEQGSAMSAISSVSSAAQLMPVHKPAATVALNASVELGNSSASPSSVVMLGQDTQVSDPLTYNVRGLMADTHLAPAWEYTRQDKVSLAMMGNFGTSATAGRFQGLGATLLSQLAQTGQNISQSVVRSSTGKALEPAELAAAQDRLHSNPANSISLTLKTASGKTIELSLSSQDDGLAVQAQVSGGDLSDDELNALNAMADGFQSAIDGLTSKPPTLKLDALTHFDATAFASVDLKTRFKLEDGSAQTLELHADADQRSVSMKGALGNLDLSVDLKNAAIRGDSGQQAKALEGYVSQIEAARKRGDGDAQLLSMFEDAFKTLHANYPDTRASSAPQTVSSIELTDTDHGLLTGLGDFSASVSENSVEGNPARPGELDTFVYNLSQTTQSKGRDALNRTLVQDQQSQLTASYHKPLPGGQKLALSTDPATQNYLYYQVSDQASSKASIGYKKGELVDATLSQSASQSTRIAKYVMGRLEKDTHTPIATAKTQSFLSVLQQALQQDKEAKLGRGTSTLKDTLAGIHAKVLLQSEPSKLNG